MHEIKIELPKVRADILKYGEIMDQARGKIGKIHERLKELFSIKFEGVYPDQPDESTLMKAAGVIAKLERASGSWLSWKFGFDARAAHKELSVANLPTIPYVRREECLANLKAWYLYWSYREDVVELLNNLAELNFPFEAPQKDSSLATLISCANIANLYNAILDALKNYPPSLNDRLTRLVDKEISIEGGGEQLNKSLMAATKYFNYLDELVKCSQTPSVSM